jgi:hypothetical protein
LTRLSGAAELAFRHERGLSQDDLAYEAEVSRSYLSQLIDPRDMNMRALASLTPIAGLLLTLVSTVNAQDTRFYAFNIPKTNPEAFVAWRKVIPIPLRVESWLYRLEATASPYTTVTVNSKSHLYGSFCKPHDCGANRVAFLMAEDGSEAAGLYVKEIGSSARELFLGNPTSEEVVLLRAMAR